MLVETALPFSAFGGVLPANMRIGVVAQQGSTIHSAQELPNGNPVLFPAPVRRRAVGTPGGLRTIALDGDGADWNGLDALFDGIAESGSPGLRMLKVFAYACGISSSMRRSRSLW